MSNLLIIHIIASSLGYILFGAAFATACLYIYRDHGLKTKRFKLDDRFPWSLHQLDYTLFAILWTGFLLMGAGLLLGMSVQKTMYGFINYASPRLIFPFFIWLFYLAILSFRFITGLRGRIPAHLSAYGFTCAALSFLYEMHIAA